MCSRISDHPPVASPPGGCAGPRESDSLELVAGSLTAVRSVGRHAEESARRFDPSLFHHTAQDMTTTEGTMTAIDNRPYNPSHLNGCPAQRTWTPYSVGCRCSELAVMARADRYWGFDQFAVNDPEPHFDCGRTDCDGGCHERTVEQFDRGQM